jgi:hypothetical protein
MITAASLMLAAAAVRCTSMRAPAEVARPAATAQPLIPVSAVSASVAPPASVATPSPVVAGAPPAPLPDRHPVLTSLVAVLDAWSPALRERLEAISLAGTGDADTDRTVGYVYYRMAGDLLLPLLRQSSDPCLVEVRHGIESAVLFSPVLALTNLMMGPAAPTACGNCTMIDPNRCSPQCQLERRRLAPASAAANGFGADMTFGGRPMAVPGGIRYTEGQTLVGFLDSLVSGGLARTTVEKRMVEIVRLTAARCRGVEAAVPAEYRGLLEPGRVLELGYAHWRATYAADFGAEPLSLTGAFQTSDEGWQRFELRMLRGVPATRAHAARLDGYRRSVARTQALYEAGKLKDPPPDPPEPSVECDRMPFYAAGSCEEAIRGLETLHDVVDSDLGGKEPPAPGAVTKVAAALERLSLAKVPIKEIDAAYRELVRSMVKSPGK